MTREEFIQWLNAEIKIMQEAKNRSVGGGSEDYFRGNLSALESVKEKFLSIVTPETTI